MNKRETPTILIDTTLLQNKTLSKLWMEGAFLTMIRNSYEKRTWNIKNNGRIMIDFPIIWGKLMNDYSLQF